MSAWTALLPLALAALQEGEAADRPQATPEADERPPAAVSAVPS